MLHNHLKPLKTAATFQGLLLLFSSSIFASDSVVPSPENHVYYYMTDASYVVKTMDVPPGEKPGFLFNPALAKGFLWVPTASKRLRGLVVLGSNVPEQYLGGHPGIRKVCTELDLGILFTCPSFRLSAVNHASIKILNQQQKDAHNVAFLQQILASLAATSGIDEVSTVPWLPIGESMSLQIVNNLTGGTPERCIAGIWVKDASWASAQPTVPFLAACGTGAEWSFQQYDVFERWREMATTDQTECIAKRTALPTWPASLVVEAGSAHFSCTEPMIDLIARYIHAACLVRLPAEGGQELRPVDLQQGYVTALPVPGHHAVPPKPYREATDEEKKLPWYFDQDSAQAAYDLAHVDWHAQTQVTAFLDPQGKPIPFSASGITDITPVMEEDGISFRLDATFLDAVPDGCVKAGTKMPRVPGAPTVEWIVGPLIPLGDHRFQLALDRSAQPDGRDQTPAVRAIHPGDAHIRLSVNPASIHIPVNKAGKPQKITFAPIPDQDAGVKSLTLSATSDAGLPVRFYVNYGPATIHGDRLELTPLPTRTRYPVTVSAVAWQWGHGGKDPVQTAARVEQIFKIVNK